MAQLWTARVTPRENHDDLAKLRRILAGMGGAYVIVREYGDIEGNLHYHACFYTEIKQPRQKFVYAYENAGNGVYSIKKCDEGMLRYILKGDSKHPRPRGDPPEIEASYGMEFTEAKIKEYHDAYWSQSEKVRNSKDVAPWLQVVNIMEANAIEFTPENVVHEVLQWIKKNYKRVVDHDAMGMSRMILCHKSRGFEKSYEASLVAKLTQFNF